MDNLKDRIEIYCRKKGISKTVFIREVGVSRGAMYKWFDGATPGERHVEKLSKLLGASSSELRYGLVPEPDRSKFRIENWNRTLAALLPPELKVKAHTIVSMVEGLNDQALEDKKNDVRALDCFLKAII